MFSKVFIKRPVLSIVCTVIILILGLISIPSLPVEQYPNISPVQIVVKANYTGASAEVVEKTVTNILERQINGVPGMRYMTSTSGNDGNSVIIVTFEQGYNQDIAAVDVQNRLDQVEPQLPEPVRQTGVSVSKQSSAVVLTLSLYSDHYDSLFLSSYADQYILDTIKRISGVAGLVNYGERRYAMRIWLNPKQLASHQLTANDVVEALREQNFQVGIGRIGQPPAVDGQQYQIDLQALGRLREVKEFNNLILKTDSDGAITRLRDVGHADLGAESYLSFGLHDGLESVAYDVLQIPGRSNTLEIAKTIKAELKQVEKDLPPDIKIGIPYDPTLFVIESRKEVVKTLCEAILLVVFVIFIFLQDWRAVLIPAITIPVTLVGTFAFVKAFNFSINSLTLFGLILATGILVDDAIVVVEDVSRRIKEDGLSPSHAAMASMSELSGALIATSLVLISVFVPVAFFPGVTGQLYKQFALTIAFGIVISTFLALTLTPSLSALLLSQKKESEGWLGRVFRLINQFLEQMKQSYRQLLNLISNLKFFVLGLFIVLLSMTWWMYKVLPTAFIPEEDQGYALVIAQGPEGVTQEYMRSIMDRIDQKMLAIPEVFNSYSLGGLGFSGNIANNGLTYVNFTPWHERKKSAQSAQAIINRAQNSLSEITEAEVYVVNPPAVAGLGSVGGFSFRLQTRDSKNFDTLLQVKDELVNRANQTPELQDVFSTFTANAPKMIVEINRDRAKVLQVDVDDILNTLETLIGSRYVNDFNAFSRNYRVYVQADKQFRSNPQNIEELYVRSNIGEMISIGELVKITSTTGPQVVNHYNLLRAIEINGSAASGYSSGQAIQAMERLAAEILPKTMEFEWAGISLEEITSAGQAPIIFGLGLVLAFLVLAVQYNNFFDPLIIMLSVPLAILGALLAQSIRGFANDVYCQVGLVMLIGLACKNAILIVEFANQLRQQGLPTTKAVLEASEARLRPIFMTTLTTLLSISPLMVATGAGYISRQSLGTAVFGGVMASTLLSLFMVPVVYIIIHTIKSRLCLERNKTEFDYSKHRKQHEF